MDDLIIKEKKILTLFEEYGGSSKSLSDLEIGALADYIVTEGINYNTIPDTLKFNTKLATQCKQRGLILPDIVMYYCFN
jgi:hypothetical protein